MKSGLIAINIAALIFGSAALYGKLDVSPFWIVAARGVFASITLILFGLVRGTLRFQVPSFLRRSLFISAGILAVHWLTFFASVQLSGVAIATLTFAAFPFFTVLIEAVKAGRRPTILEVGASAAILVAVSLLVDLQDPKADLIGIVAGLTSALAFAVFGISSKRLTTQLTPLMVSIFQNLCVAVYLAPVLFFVGGAPGSLNDWLWLVVLGVVTTALMHQLYLYALTKLSAATCSGFVALEPVYAVAFAAVLFDEPLTLWILVSGALIIGASFLLLKSEAKSVILNS